MKTTDTQIVIEKRFLVMTMIIVLLLAVSIFVAFLASFFPVKKIASKKPIDAIRNR